MKVVEKHSAVTLPYNKEQYFNFLDTDHNGPSDWHAVSFQVLGSDERNVEVKNADVLEPLFKNIIATLDNGAPWIADHFFRSEKWFSKDAHNLISLRALFRDSNVKTTFKGPLLFTKDDLFKVVKDLILYPYILSRQDLDISHSQLPFIIKTSQHLCIDLFSTDKMLLRKILAENTQADFIVKEYRSSSLWE